MYNLPKLSIISVNLNNAAGLRKTMESVFCQTFTDFEYLIIDGGSVDGSVEIIKEFASKITYWVSEPDKGTFNAMNKGILKAKGEYCLFLNSGDYFPAINILKSIISKFSEGSDIIYCNGYFEDKKCRKEIRFNSSLTKDFFFNSSLMHPSSYIKKEIIINLGLFDEKLRFCADYDFFVKCFVNKFKYQYIDIFSSVFSVGGVSTEKSYSKFIIEENQIIRKKYFSNEELLSQILVLEFQLEAYQSNLMIRILNKLCKKV